MKKIATTVAFLAFISFSTSAALAAEGGNPKKGKYLYKKSCKTCHVDGERGGALTPLSKTMGQWDRFFEKEEPKAMEEAWKQFSEQDLKDVQQFLFDHAVDSDQPETCG